MAGLLAVGMAWPASERAGGVHAAAPPVGEADRGGREAEPGPAGRGGAPAHAVGTADDRAAYRNGFVDGYRARARQEWRDRRSRAGPDGRERPDRRFGPAPDDDRRRFDRYGGYAPYWRGEPWWRRWRHGDGDGFRDEWRRRDWRQGDRRWRPDGDEGRRRWRDERYWVADGER